MNERVPLRCGGELHWMAIDKDCHLVPESRFHDLDLERSLVEMGAEAPKCIEASNYSFAIDPETILRDPSVPNSMRDTVMAMWSKHVHPKVLIEAAIPYLREVLPYYEDAFGLQFRSSKLRRRPRDAADLLELYVQGKASTANMGHMHSVLAKAALNLDSIRSRAFKSWWREKSEEHNEVVDALSSANTVMNMARQLVDAAKLDPDAPSPSDPNRHDWTFVTISHRDNHLLALANAMEQYIALQFPTGEIFADEAAAYKKEREIDCEQARSIARAAMKHWKS